MSPVESDALALWSVWVESCGLSAAQRSYLELYRSRPVVSYLTRRPRGRG